MRVPRRTAHSGRGVAFELHAYEFGRLAAGIALEAADLIGVEPARVLKTLMAMVDEPMLVVTLLLAHRELDLNALASAVGGKRAAMADVKQAERATATSRAGSVRSGSDSAHPP